MVPDFKANSLHPVLYISYHIHSSKTWWRFTGTSHCIHIKYQTDIVLEYILRTYENVGGDTAIDVMIFQTDKENQVKSPVKKQIVMLL